MGVRQSISGLLNPSAPLGRNLRLARLAARSMTMHDVIHREALRNPGLQFIQIGANDGVAADPLHPFIERFGWTGALVEPQPHVFVERLEPLYGRNPRIQLINAAIGPVSGTLPLHVISFSTDRWASGRATLNRSVLEAAIESGEIARVASQHGIVPPQDQGEWIHSIEVPVITVEELLERTGLTNAHLLHVDTEGADGEIVRQFDIRQLALRLVQFEHAHLSPEDLRETCEHLSSGNFVMHYDKMDVLASRSIDISRTAMRTLREPWDV